MTLSKQGCSVDGCNKKRFARSWCVMHYKRFEKQGLFVRQPRPVSWGAIEKHPLLHTWRWISRRVGVNGLKISQKWLDDPRKFFDHVGNKPSQDHKLKLIDSELGYVPNNLEWVETKIKIVSSEAKKQYARDYQREYRKRNLLNTKNSALKKSFGMTIEQYLEKLETQGHKCAICGTDETFIGAHGRKTQLAVDHNHDTGQIRGLLCNKCNTGLGHFRENPDILQKAIEYLAYHNP